MRSRTALPTVSAATTLGPELDFLRLLWRLDHAMQRRSKRMARELGLTGPQRLVLRILGRYPGLPAGELAALLHVHPSTITGILQRLEKRGWIKRRADPKDGRRVLVGLTERGRVFDDAGPVTMEGVLRRLFAAGARKDVAAAARLLDALASELETGAKTERDGRATHKR